MQNGNCSKCCPHLTEIDHRVANHFALLSSFVMSKAREAGTARDEPTRLSTALLLDEIAIGLDAFAKVHRSLAQDRSAADADLAEHLHNTCAAYRLSVPQNIVIEEAFDAKCTLPFERLFCVIQVFSELLTNAIKYAPLGRGPCSIRVSCREGLDRAIIIDVVDDGRGLPPGFDLETQGGIGMRLIRALTKQLGATVAFEPTSCGLHARFCVPFRPNSVDAGTIAGTPNKVCG
jgi:two-component sensor histidine kinase